MATLELRENNSTFIPPRYAAPTVWLWFHGLGKSNCLASLALSSCSHLPLPDALKRITGKQIKLWRSIVHSARKTDRAARPSPGGKKGNMEKAAGNQAEGHTDLGDLGVFPLCSRKASALAGLSTRVTHFFLGCRSRGRLLQGERLAE